MNWKLTGLPVDIELETKPVLKSLPAAHSALAELKGIATSIPNQSILINALGIQEAKDSSAIENIFTTHDDLYRSGISLTAVRSSEAKEVQNYVSALKKGFASVQKEGLLTNRTILQVQEVLEQNSAGYRKLPGTVIKNDTTGEILYTPPQHHDEIVRLMKNLEEFINDRKPVEWDAITKMAVIHFQFESIHPFYDGNGRTGRILNILYLIQKGLLNHPVLYLSSYFIKHKAEYYRRIQEVRTLGNWEQWLLFVSAAIEVTSRETIAIILQIKEIMLRIKHLLRSKYKFYSQDLLNNLFMHPYTKIDFLVRDLGVTRLTASNYLNRLAEDGILRKERIGTGNYYINEPLFEVLSGL
jgi:Fic family protein